MEKLITYFKLSRAELRKIISPTKEQVRNAFITVFVVVFAIALFLWIVDWAMSLSISSFIG